MTHNQQATPSTSASSNVKGPRNEYKQISCIIAHERFAFDLMDYLQQMVYTIQSVRLKMANIDNTQKGPRLQQRKMATKTSKRVAFTFRLRMAHYSNF